MLYICPNCGKRIKSRAVPEHCPACLTLFSGTWPFPCRTKRKTWWLYFVLIAGVTFYPVVYKVIFPPEIIAKDYRLYLFVIPLWELFLWVNLMQPRVFLYRRFYSGGTFAEWEYFPRDSFQGSFFSFIFFGFFDLILSLIVSGSELYADRIGFVVIQLPHIICFALSLAGIWFPHFTRFDLTYYTMIWPMENKHGPYSWSALYWFAIAILIVFIARGIKTIM